MKKHAPTLFICLFVYLFICLFVYSPVFAQGCECNADNIQKAQNPSDLSCINAKCNEAAASMESAVKPHREELQKMNAAIAAFQARIKLIEIDVAKKSLAINQGEKKLGGLLTVAYQKIRTFYVRSFVFNPMTIFFSSNNIGSVLRIIGYQQAAINEDKKAIIQTAISVKDLEDKKKALEEEKASLATLKADTDRRAVSIRKLVAEAEAYESQLVGLIAQITSKQQEFLGQKLAGLNLPTSLGGGPLYCTDDRKLDPGFSPAFAFYTFGIPHRVGMNQYGAFGRANASQTYQDILRSYFDGINFEKRSNVTIRVEGYGSMPLEQYLLGIYEMPVNWPIEAQKAQAVAARSYALAYTNNGANEICTTQKCQVYKGGNKGGDWERAIRETEGEVMIRDGQVITAWYASTAGGYTFTSGDVGWNNRSWTKRTRDANGDVGSFSDLMSKAYDKDSPCFYSAQGWRKQYANSAWLKSEEIADIVNTILLARKDSSIRSHLYQPDKPNPQGVDTWDQERVKQELRQRSGTPYSNVSGVSIVGVDWSVGRTTQVSVSGDAGTNTFDGSEFKDYFNLRSPANIQIVGPLFNVERK